MQTLSILHHPLIQNKSFSSVSEANWVFEYSWALLGLISWVGKSAVYLSWIIMTSVWNAHHWVFVYNKLVLSYMIKDNKYDRSSVLSSSITTLLLSYHCHCGCGVAIIFCTWQKTCFKTLFFVLWERIELRACTRTCIPIYTHKNVGAQTCAHTHTIREESLCCRDQSIWLFLRGLSSLRGQSFKYATYQWRGWSFLQHRRHPPPPLCCQWSG